jgi:hypothetical protein
MKRIAAREFLLLVGCMALILLVALFGWGRNAWLARSVQASSDEIARRLPILDSLNHNAQPRQLAFVGLFDTTFLRTHNTVFSLDSAWIDGLNPLSEMSRVYVGILVNALVSTGYHNPLASPKHPEGSLSDLGALVKRKFPNAYPNLSDHTAGVKARERYPIAFAQYSDGAATRISTESTLWEPPPKDLQQRVDGEMAMMYGAVHIVDESWDGHSARGWSGKAIPEMEQADMKAMKSTFIQIGVQYEELQVYPETLVISSTYAPRLVLGTALMNEVDEQAQFHSAFEHLVDNNVLKCTFDELLLTTQRRPVPPTTEAQQALSEQKTAINELEQERNNARTGLWSAAKQWEVVKWAAIVLFVLVWPLRLLLLGTRWALRTVRS